MEQNQGLLTTLQNGVSAEAVAEINCTNVCEFIKRVVIFTKCTQHRNKRSASSNTNHDTLKKRTLVRNRT